MSVLVETTIGDLVFDLYTEKRPRSCLNFLKLCKIKYYNFCLFHSVRRNFIAQCGDPTGSGRGGESVYSFVYGDQAKYFDLELKPRIKHNTKGTISFVNNGNDMHGSQFFITLGDGLDFLDGKHTVFGQLAEGFDVLEKLNETICDDNHKPYQDVRISHTVILDDPFDDPKGLNIPDRSPEPTKEQLESGRIGADEDIDDKGRSKEEIEKELEDKELKIGTKILETVGDIGDADLKPPENILFVCKLNPVTNAEDLKIIFSRFGKIISCEIITDHKTGDSLCYGFVEFKEIEACEKAYFKMDNVLIDDRRIHVDFCQSVAKIKKWHRSNLYKKALDEQNEKRKDYALKDKSRKDNENYSMVFAEEDIPTPKSKKKKKEERSSSKKKNFDSESDEEEERRRKTKRKSVQSRKRRESSSLSDDDEKVVTEKSSKKARYESDLTNKKPRKSARKYSESDYSSDENNDRKYSKRKSTSDSKTMRKPNERKDKKKSKYSDSESDYEPKKTQIKKEKKKSLSNYSDSESDDKKNQRSKKNKNPRRRKKSSSEEEQKEKSKTKAVRKSTDSKRNVSVEDSDTEEYVESKSNKKKKRRYSSDDSSEERRRTPKMSRTKRRYSSSERDDTRRTSIKKSGSSKKMRRRNYSDSD